MSKTMENEALDFVKALKEAWTKGGNVERLKEYFHPAMAALTATDREILEGRNACFESWRKFAQTAKIRRWNELQPQVRLFGDAAVATCYFDMDGNAIDLDDRDMCVLARKNGRRRAVADQSSPYPAG